MMIETKGTKSGAAPPDGARKYASQDPDAKSGTPYYLALAVAALAAYLKSMFRGPAEAAPGIEEAAQPRLAGPKPVPATSSEAQANDPGDEPRPTKPTQPSSWAEAPASEYDSPTFLRHKGLHFAKPEQQPNLGDFKASPVIPSPTNDNRGAAGGGGGGGGQAGGGGGRGEPGESPRGVEPDFLSRPRNDGISPRALDDEGGPSNAGPTAQDGTRPDERVDEDGGTGVPSVDKVPTGDGPGGTDGRRNRAPVSTGPVYLSDVSGCALLAIAMADLLKNVSDPDGDTLSVRNVTVSSGALAPDGDGWTFDGDAVGPVTVTYEVTDGEFSVTQTASFNVVERDQVIASNGDDVILGTLCADEIDGRGGDDIIDARAGSDVVDGGAGDDHVVGGAGDDTVRGGEGDDVVFAGAGADVVSGGNGDDRIFGEAGDDLLFGDAGDDLLEGGDGNDMLRGATGSDTLYGDEGDDRLDGGEGNDLAFGGAGRDVVSGGDGDDRLEGGDGDDVLSEGSGRDLVTGQEGADVVIAAPDGDDDRFDGGVGEDTLDLTATASGVTVDLPAGIAVGPEIGRNQVVSFEIVQGGSGADVLIGDAEPDGLVGGAGRDRLAGGGGDDLLDGGADSDTLSDGTGSDVVSGGTGDDVMVVASDAEADRFDGGAGEDTLDLSAANAGVVVDLAGGTVVGAETGNDTVASVEIVVGGNGADIITGSPGHDTLFGRTGQDHVAGGAGDDVLGGGDDDDVLSDGAGSDVVLGGAGDDLVTVASDGEEDSFDGGEGRDTLDLSSTRAGVIADLAAGTLRGVEIGRDVISRLEAVVGGSGADDLAGSIGGDGLSGGDGDDRLSGRAGDDVLDGGAGRDTILDGAGRDVVRSGAGDDRIVLAMDGDDDLVDGGDGFDTLDLASATGNLLVDLVDHVVSGTELGEDRVASMERIVAGSGHDRFVIGDEDVILTGGGGNDGYEFVSRPGTREPTRAVEITDFSVGDHVDLLIWSLFEDGPGTEGYSLAEAMERNDGSVSGIRYRSATIDQGDYTVISADLDRDDRFETTIVLDGHHTLLFVELPARSGTADFAMPVN